MHFTISILIIPRKLYCEKVMFHEKKITDQWVPGSERNYHVVAVKIPEGGFDFLSIGEWKKISIIKRLHLVKEGKATYLLNSKMIP